MATTPQNNLVRVVGAYKTLPYPVDMAGSHDFNAGDMLCYDGTQLVAATDGAAATFVGVAQDSAALNVYGTKVYQPQMNAIIGQLHSMKATVGDSIAHMTAVYVGADAQTVVVADPGSHKAIGYIVLRAGQAAFTAVAGSLVDVLIIPQLPYAGVA